MVQAKSPTPASLALEVGLHSTCLHVELHCWNFIGGMDKSIRRHACWVNFVWIAVKHMRGLAKNVPQHFEFLSASGIKANCMACSEPHVHV